MTFYSSSLSKLPHIKHGFFTKEFNIGEKTLHEQENLQHIQSYLKGDTLLHLRQKHLSICHNIDQLPKGRLTGDALITQKPHVILCIKTADCAPILIAHKTRPIIAAIHAGWRGAIFEKIIENTADILKHWDSLSNYVVAIGPCLHQTHFEVGPLIYNNITDKRFFSNALPLVIASATKQSRQELKLDHVACARDDGKKYFNSPLFVQTKLEKLGFIDIDCLNLDTYSNENEFFSFRRSTHKKEDATGRQGSAIMIK